MQLRIDGARVWDGEAQSTSNTPISLGISDSKIVSMEARGEQEADEVILCPPGSVMIPGLIDAHVHLDLDPAIMKPDGQFEASRHDRDLRMIARAEAMVRAGITTARDLGAGEWREILLRDAIARKEATGPRLLCAGQPLTITEGHCHFWGGVADGKKAREEVIRRQLDHEVDWIKVMATGGVFTPGSRVDGAQFSEREIQQMVAIADRAGRSVAAHCHGRDGIRNAARAGVRTIEHCSFAGQGGFGVDYDARVVSEIASQQAWVSPTINGNWQYRMHKNGELTDFYRRTRVVLAGLKDAGVPMIASTDAGIPGVHHHGLWAGLVAMAHYAALSPREALCSATSESARALGLEGTCGILRPGLSADLVILASDPLHDLGQLAQPLWVVAQGSVVRRP
ncbi:MAG: amidohydrolase family protein [Myxococcota bacterium]|nr:amidohydrolase family protein [Myxococcota bacterium]